MQVSTGTDDVNEGNHPAGRFLVPCGYPTCHSSLWGACTSSHLCDPSEVPVACHWANLSRLGRGWLAGLCGICFCFFLLPKEKKPKELCLRTPWLWHHRCGSALWWAFILLIVCQKKGALFWQQSLLATIRCCSWTQRYSWQQGLTCKQPFPLLKVAENPPLNLGVWWTSGTTLMAVSMLLQNANDFPSASEPQASVFMRGHLGYKHL